MIVTGHVRPNGHREVIFYDHFYVTLV